MSDPLLVPNPKLNPSPEGAQPINIRPGSAMAVIGLFVEVIRQRFSPACGLPWVWYEDIKKGEDKGIAIESAFNEDKDHKNYRAAVYVDRDEQIIGRTVLGDLAGMHIPSGMEGFWALESVPILIECIAAKKSESAIIADLTGIYLHASSNLIQAKFGLHDMTPLSLGRTQPFPRDKTQWTTSLSFTVQYNLRWTTKPSAALLQQVELNVTRSGADSATEFFEKIALAGRP